MADLKDLQKLDADLTHSKKEINEKYDITKDTDPHITDEDDFYIEDVSPKVNTIDTLNTTNATASASCILKGKTSYYNNEKITGEIEYLEEKIYTPGTEDIIIEAGKYVKEPQIIQGDANLKAENIKTGTSIFGIAGSCTGQTSLQLDDTNVTASDVAQGKKIYSYNKSTNNGQVITGTLADNRSAEFSKQIQGYSNEEFIFEITNNGIYDKTSYCVVTEQDIKNYAVPDPTKIRKGVTILGVEGELE